MGAWTRWRWLSVIVFGSVAGLGIAEDGFAQTSTLPAIADTYLRQGNPNRNQGGESFLRLRESGDNRTLIRFDQGAIEAAAAVGSLVSATLELSIDSIANWGPDGRSVDVHRVATAWTEAGATWTCADDSQPSNSSPDCDPEWAGGTFEEDATDSVLHVNGLSGPVAFDVTADVAAFLAGAPNHGWLLKKFDEGAVGRVDYVSREGPAVAAPRLVLVVESPSFDEVPPTLRFTAPELAIVVGDPRPTIAVEFADGGTGIDLGSVEVRVDGTDITPSCAVGAATAECEPDPLGPGEHTATATVRDLAGNDATAGLEFELLLGSGTQAATFSAIADSYLRQGHPNQNQGGESVLRVRQSGKNRALVRFDPGELAAVVGGSSLVAAHLELYVVGNGNNWGPSGREVGAHRLATEWTEAGVTWNCGDDPDPLDQQAECAPQWNGGAFEPAATDLVLHTNGLAGWVRFDVTADVAASLAGTPDRGWLIKKAQEGASGRIDYGSREGAASEGPRLVVTFETAPGGDGDPPEVAIAEPVDGAFLATASPTVRATYADGGSGIDTAAVRLVLDGLDRTAEAVVGAAELTFLPAAPLAEGAHDVVVRVADLAGNPAETAAAFVIDTVPPTLTVTAPPGPVVIEDPTPAVEFAFADATSGPDLASLHLFVDQTELTASCTVTGSTAACTAPTLEAGGHTVSGHLRDRAGNLVTTNHPFELVVDDVAPALTITSPAAPVVVGDPTPTIAVAFSDALSGVDAGSLRILLDGAPLSGCTVDASSAQCQPPPLLRGDHVVTAEVADLRGNLATAQRDFTAVLPLAVGFTSPAPDTVLASPVTEITGFVDESAVAVEVNGVEAALGGGVFTVAALGLHDGVNHVVAVARDAAGNVGTAVLRLFADTSPPQIGIASPADGARLATPIADVGGLVNDLTLGTVSETVVTVTVNGVAAEVRNRSFLARGVSLVPGRNLLTAVATDRAGLQATAEVEVFLEDRTGVPTLRVVSGHDQAAQVSTALPEPLVVEVRDAAGDPQPDAQVVFRVAQGDGSLAGGGRTALVVSDSQGRAAIGWTLGRRAGVAVHRVQANAVGVPGAVEFLATAVPGPPAAIHVVSGDNQRAAVGADLPQPLVAVVFDDDDNPLPDAPVTFRVVAGDGGFGGSSEIAATTDSSGLAAAALTLAAEAGVDRHVVEATVDGVAAAFPATFKASAFVPGDPSATEIVGVVLDNQGDPVPGVTLRLRDAPQMTTADSQGQFRLTGVAPGRVFLIVDASTSTRPGQWASLEFELFTVPGVVNTLERPVYILPLDLTAGVLVDETHGGTVTVPDVPGLELEVAPGSVTFPGGGRSGVVSVTTVHADRIPMAPGGGMQPRLIVTVQPAGAHFDPPAVLTLPNFDGLPPGAVTELFSFDHDLGAFVAIGTGTVSEDGRVVRSDPGFGILEAGWHCGAPPSGSGSGGSLSVKLSPDPIKIQYGSTAAVTAEGRPPLDGEYRDWRVTSSNIDTDLTFAAQPSCPGATSCANTLVSGGPTSSRATVCGTAQAEVTFFCTTTGKSTTGTATIEQGCCGKSAQACRSNCESEQNGGMCGSPCDLCGPAPPPFNPTVHACWRVNVNDTWFCYWDLTAPGAPGFVDLCCPNRCEGVSNTPWIGTQRDPFLCTVSEPCAGNPAFGDADEFGPGRRCVPAVGDI